MNEIVLIFILIINTICKVTSKDVLGCGGFVKSHVPIDFSKVEVKLLTKQGIVKDKINCAPNNGYYFVPLYDKGEYILELEPPPGWSFEPTKVDLAVDGVSDSCSQGKDIDFVFKGFGITGKVESLGSTTGPEGVEVELKSDSETRKTLTSSGGNFFFTPVYPGNYIVRISNSRAKSFKESVNVVVAEGNTELPARSLVIQGYQVTGFIKTAEEPVKDATIALFSSGSGEVKVEGCNKSILSGVPGKNKFICHVKSDENGVFTFPTVPVGKYFVSPHYGGQNIYYQPEMIEFTIEHNNVELTESFEIIGFSVSGRVLKSPDGVPISRALIFVDGNESARTNSEGFYKLDKLKAGTYMLKATIDGFLFKETPVKVNPNTNQLPDLIPSSYKVCGTVISDKSQTVTFAQIGSTRIVTTFSSIGNGKFCEFLNPGKYQVQVVVDSGETQKGLQFFPNVQTIEVSSAQIENIVFSQLKATIVGRVECIQKKDCVGLKVILRSKSGIGGKNDVIINITDNTYKVSDIYPGIYELTLSDNKLCWKANKHSINVNNVNVEVPTFIQIGYSVVFISSHDTQVTYKLMEQSTAHSIEISRGKSSHCLEKAGTYNFQIKSCHSYESNSVSYNTDVGINEIFLNAIKHTVTLFIESQQKYGDVSATINIDGTKTQSGPLPFTKSGYQIDLLLSPSESAVIIPQSSILYFTPPILSIGGSLDCANLGAKFQAVKGVVFEGKIIPPLLGVLVTVESENTDALLAETDQNGVYKFPPLDASKSYKLSAKKESYVLVGPNEQGNFFAHKLAEIVIEVVDDVNRAPLQEALLSLSGGESYRSNLQTNENGRITFHSLSPSEYFLRPMMKEYSFEPNSQIIPVKEGQTVHVQLIGRRVAYSAYGQVTSLNMDPEEGIVVVARGVANCSHFSEEGTSEASGTFRIRGLQPYCSYDITIKGNGNGKYPIERSAPKSIHIERVTEDILGLKLVIFRPIANMDLLVKVYAKNPEYYKSLRLKVAREAPFSGVIYNGRVDTSSVSITNDYNYGVLIYVPPIPIDGKTYSVHLESNLNNKLEPEPRVFVANSSFKYVELDFVVKSNVTEQDIKQTSVWTLVFIFTIMFAVYNVDKVSFFLKDNVGGYVADLVSFTNRKSTTNDYPPDNGDIDQIVQSINAIKRKPKPKKL